MHVAFRTAAGLALVLAGAGAGVAMVVDSRCGRHDLEAAAPPSDSIVCRNIHFVGIDTAQGTALVAFGPTADRDAAGNWLVLRYPYGMLCSAPARQPTIGP